MSNKIKIGILGYGNLGKAVDVSVRDNEDMELISIFTRRNPSEIKSVTNSKVTSVKEISDYKDKIDILILCGGSATDLPTQTPEYAKLFNVIDYFHLLLNLNKKHGWKGSNSRHSVLETDALPTELRP